MNLQTPGKEQKLRSGLFYASFGHLGYWPFSSGQFAYTNPGVLNFLILNKQIRWQIINLARREEKLF